MQYARKFTLVVAANTQGAYEDGLAEALRLIQEGNLSGADSNGESGFYFDSEQAPENALPRV